MPKPAATLPHDPLANLAAGLHFGALDVAARSRLGAGPRLRAENQDNVVLIDTTGQAVCLRDGRARRQHLPGWRPGHARLAVLDGMGGHGHGREAAEAVAAGLLALPPCDSTAELTRALDALHADLQRHFAGSSGPRPGTTLTLLELPAGQAPLLWHVGDSRLYEIARTRVAPLSVDHVPATAFAMAGLLGETEWWQQVHGEHRPQVSQAFILGNAFSDTMELADPLFELVPANLPAWLRHLPDRRAIPLRPGASYLLATDGLWSCSDPAGWVSQWPQLLSRADVDADAMLAALLAAYEAHPAAFFYPDNVSAILLRAPALDTGDETALPGA
jgi:serine/threonine protein phosphatase PrpC